MRLIDADALKDMDIEPCDVRDCIQIKERTRGMNYIRRIVKEAPTVDAVPVVRCRDCRYGSECLMEVFQCKLTCRVHSADWFCADGKRKGGDE